MLNRKALSTNTYKLNFMLRVTTLFCFTSSTDARQDLEHGSQTLGDDPSLVTNVSSGESAPPMEHKETPNSSITTPEDVRTVEIRGFLPRTSKKIVVMFVENESENEPESCIYDEQKGVAVVTFPNTGGTVLLS